MVTENDLRDSNPWWDDQTKILGDKKIHDWEGSRIRHKPRLMHEIVYDFEPDNTVVYTLRGPRQIGKTTLVKLQIRDFLDNGINPWNIFYYSLDAANTKQDVIDIIKSYLELSVGHKEDNRTYIFLDEASSVKDWQKGIKWLVDMDKLFNCTVMATGSQAINITRAAERLPGRRGVIEDNYDKILFPMKFTEYASMLSSDINEIIHENKLLTFRDREMVFRKLLNGDIDEGLDKLHGRQNETNRLLKEYMLTGGTPKIVDEKIRTNAIKESTYTDYLVSITGQWKELGKNDVLLKQFGGAIIKSLANHTSWSSLAKESALGSKNTAMEYAYTLQDLFVLSIIHLYGDEKKIPMIQSDRKFYFHDPFFLHMFNGWMKTNVDFKSSLEYLEDEINQSKVVEGIVADHLIRWAFSTSKKKQTFDHYDHIFYWKDDKNREVDFVLYEGKGMETPIEVKFRNKLNLKELSPMVNFLCKTGNERGLVISKNRFVTKTDYTIIPASLFLMLI